MRRLVLLIAALCLGLAAPAAAWVEQTPYPIPHDGVADCLRAAGPGRIALLGHIGRTTAATDLLSVGANGFAPGPSTTLGWLATCPSVGVASGAPPLLVAPVLARPRSVSLVVRAADAGAIPAALGAGGEIGPSPSVALAPNGAAVVAWEQLDSTTRPLQARVLAATRPAGHPRFGPATTLGFDSGFSSGPVAGIDATGHATIAWQGSTHPGRASLLQTVSTTSDGRFATSVPVASVSGDQLAIAVTPGGRTLIANYGSGSIAAYERVAGASAFAPVPVFSSQSPDELALALNDDGSAVIAYRTNPGGLFASDSGSNDAFALLRGPGGAFDREQPLAARPSQGDSSRFSVTARDLSRPGPPSDQQGSHIATALDASGHVVVTWVDPGNRRGAASAHVAYGTIAGGMARATQFGSPCRSANAAQPLVLAGGLLGAAWTDNARMRSLAGSGTPSGGGLLHVLTPGRSAGTAAPPAPGLSAQLVGPHALLGGQPLRVRVRCRRGPCLVRALATSHGLRGSEYDNQASLVGSSTEVPRGHGAVIEIEPSESETFAPANRKPATISLLACAVTGPHVTRVSLHVRLRRLPQPPLPRVLGLVARRHGSRISVAWRTSAPALGVTFLVVAGPGDPSKPLYAVVHGSGHRRFSATLHVPRGEHERAVSVVLLDSSSGQQSKPVTVSIR